MQRSLIYTGFFGGAFNGRLTNRGTVTLVPDGVNPVVFTAGNGMENDASFTISSGQTVTLNGAGLDNESAISISGGTLGGAGPMLNKGNLSGYGTITGSGTFNNFGQITQAGGTLTFSNSGFSNNGGEIDLSPGFQFQLNGGTWNNNANINLNGGTISGSATLFNNGGTIRGPGIITAGFNNPIGTIIVPAGLTSIASSGVLTNQGTTILTDPASDLSAFGSITNTGTIQGQGTVTSSTTDSAGGTIEAIGGTLIFTKSMTTNAGTFRVSTGNKILLSAGLTTNASLISLTGGTFDTNGHALNNTGQITGYGTLATSSLTNNGSMTFTGGESTINGDITNAATRTILVKFQPATFTGNIINNGTIKTTNTLVTFTGTYTGNAYISDPSTNIFQNNVTIIPGGSMTGGTGDQFIFDGGTFTNNGGTFTNGGLLQSSENSFNSGAFTQSGTQQWTAGTTFTNTTGGAATFASDAGSATSSPLSITVAGGNVTFASAQHLAALTVSGSTSLAAAAQVPSATNPLILTIPTLTLSAGGKLDLANDELLTQSTPLNTRTQLSGGQLFTSTAGGAVGYRDIGGGTIEARFTLLGDSDLDGRVNVADLANLAGNFGQANGQFWISGDFDYNGNVNVADLADLAGNFGKTLSSGGLAAPASLAVNSTSVPEPTSLGLLLTLATAALLPRRGRPRALSGVVR
jgi:hypothetical protein